MRLLVSILTIFLLFGLSFANEKAKEMDKVFTKLQQEAGFNGNVLVAEKGKVIYKKSFGYANYENKTPLTKDSIFDIASITKTFTAVAIMKLVEKRKLSLDDKITKYLPKLPYENVTIRHMLSHTSGIIEHQKPLIRKEIEGKGFNNRQVFETFVKINPKLDFEPNSKWSYSNTNYAFLALVIEKVSGKSYAKFLKKHIFRKAKMKNTFVLRKGVPQSLQNRIVDGYFRDGVLSPKYINRNKLGFVKRHYATFENTYGEGKIFSTTGDLFKYHKALQKGKILKKRTLKKMYEPIKLTSGKKYKVTPIGHYPSVHGLGWEVAIDKSNGKVIFHTGAEPGTKSYYLRNVEKDRMVVVMTNNYLTKHQTCTFPMKVLEGKTYDLQKKSIAFAIAKEYKSSGIKNAIHLFRKLENDKNYRLSEDNINSLGYEILEKKDIKAAIEIFKINTEKFPKSGNVWDSLGEAYLKDGNKKQAIKNYKKSLELDPKNTGAKKIIEKLEAKN